MWFDQCLRTIYCTQPKHSDIYKCMTSNSCSRWRPSRYKWGPSRYNPTKYLSNKSIILTRNNYTYFGSAIYIREILRYTYMWDMHMDNINSLNWVHVTFMLYCYWLYSHYTCNNAVVYDTTSVITILRVAAPQLHKVTTTMSHVNNSDQHSVGRLQS